MALDTTGPVHVDDNGGSLTVDGTVAVTQATGTNLHTVVDSGVITSVTSITNALPTGNNVIGHVIHDTGSTTAVTGNVTVVQPTGTNLHALLDTGSTTAVTAAVGSPVAVRESDGTGFVKMANISGNRYMGVSLIQDVLAIASNSSTTNLGAGTSFTGTSSSTLGVMGVQVAVFADQNLTVQIQQAQEDPGTNWNIIDSWTYTASSTGQDCTRTIQAMASAFRVVVTNNGASTTTVFRLTCYAAPIADTSPRGLTQLGNLRTAISEALPTGTNTVGSVKVTDGTTTAKVTVGNAQPASSDGAVLVNPIHTFAGTALTSASRTPATYTTDITNYNGKGIKVWQDLTVLGASSVCSFKIQEKDPVSGKFLDVLASAATGAGVNGTGTYTLTVYPGVTVAANVAASQVLPVNIRISVTVATAASTFSQGYSIIP